MLRDGQSVEEWQVSSALPDGDADGVLPLGFDGEAGNDAHVFIFY